MTGHEDTVLIRYEKALVEVTMDYPEYDVIEPYEMSKIFDYDGIKKDIIIESYDYYLNKDIDLLKKCDAIYLCEGWEKSNGCNVELETARELGMEEFYQ